MVKSLVPKGFKWPRQVYLINGKWKGKGVRGADNESYTTFDVV